MADMEGKGRRPAGWTRRALLTGLAGVSLPVAADVGRPFPSDRVRFLDRATEFEVLRLTDPSYSSFLPHYYARAFARKRNALLFACDRAGSIQGFQMDLKTGASVQLTEATGLDASSLTWLPDERSCCYFDGVSLRQLNVANRRSREIYRVPDGWRRGSGFSVSGDGVHAFLMEIQADTCRLRIVGIAKGDAVTVAESNEVMSDPVPRPRRSGVLYRRGSNALWLVNYDGQQNRPLKTAPGGLGPFQWSPDGKSIIYLNFPEDRRDLNSLREHTPDSNSDELISKTSQFVHFGLNADASVFVGTSGSKASPYLLLMLRVTHRELTLCEHRASEPNRVTPVFTPDSQQIVFQSDRDGKLAIYAVRVDRLVEKTDS
jgi:oligogalacturonide lyase